MGLIDALRRLFTLSSLDKIERAIDGLSEEDLNDLFQWMEEPKDIVYDPKKDGKTQHVRDGWY
jgi:hypothetical protein